MFPKQYHLDSQGDDKSAENGADGAKSQVSGTAKGEASYAATTLRKQQNIYGNIYQNLLIMINHVMVQQHMYLKKHMIIQVFSN